MLSRLQSITYTLFLFLIPLLVTTFSKELFEFPKIIFLYFISGLIILFSASTFKFNFAENNQKLLLGSFSLILLSNIISFVFSIDHYSSLFGYYTRFNGGLISLLCITAWMLFIIAQNLKQKNVEQSLYILLTSGLIISVYAILQKLGIDKNLWNDDSTKRVFSTLGQPNWLAAYLIPIFFLSLYFGSKLKTYFLLKFIPAIIVYVAILFTYSLSGILAFFISILVYAFLNISEIKIYFVKYGKALVILFLLSFALAIPLRTRINDQIENMSGIVSLLKTDEAQDLKPNYGDTGKIRLILWDGTLNLILSSPKQFLIGSGPETFVYAFTKFRPDSINATSEAGFVHNKPHNWYLEIFANLGLIGFISYLSFIFAVIYLFAKSKKDHLSKIFFCGWISILITNFFGWPTVPLTILFFVFPIFMNYKNFERDDEVNEKINLNFFKLFTIFLAGNFLILSCIIFAVSDYYYKEGKFELAHKLNPFEPRYQLYSIIYNRENTTVKTIKDFYGENKNNPYIVKTLVGYLDQLIKADQATNEVKELRIEIIEDARKVSPSDKQFRVL